MLYAIQNYPDKTYMSFDYSNDLSVTWESTLERAYCGELEDILEDIHTLINAGMLQSDIVLIPCRYNANDGSTVVVDRG